MREFKVGDRVVTTKDSAPYFAVGAEGTIVALDTAGTSKVKFTSGDYNTWVNEAINGMWAMNYGLELAKPCYSASFTQQTSGVGFGDFIATGHQDNGSGIQKHSVGDYYPWLVVGYGHGEHHVFCIQNLETGATLGDFWGGDMNHTVRQWDRYYGAEAYLKNYLQGTTNPFSVKARPIYGKPEFIDGVLQIKA